MENLKFRAWEKHEKKYNHKVLVGNLDINDDNYTSCLIFKDKEWVHFDEHSEIVLEQYTGLKDKNGTEIYVGDIVKLVFIGDFEEVTEVKSIFEFAQWNWDNILTVEIIGNIHENKELLD